MVTRVAINGFGRIGPMVRRPFKDTARGGHMQNALADIFDLFCTFSICNHWPSEARCASLRPRWGQLEADVEQT